MKRKLTIAAIALVALAAALGLGIMVGPRLVQEEIETRLKQKLAERGIDAQWGGFEADGARSFEIADVRIAAPRYGLQFASDLVVVGVSLDSIWSGEITLTEVRVEPTQVELDLDALLGGEESAAANTNDGPRGESRTDQIIRHILENPPVVRLAQTNILVRRGDAPLLRITSPAVSVEKDWSDFDIHFEGEAQLLLDSAPELARRPIPWKVHGELVPDEGRFNYEVTAPDGTGPLVRIDVPELLALEVGRVWGEGTVADRTAALNIDGAELVLGPGEVAALHARAPKAAVSLQSSGRPRVEVHQPSVYVSPKRRDAITSALRELRGSGGAAQPGAAKSAGSGTFTRLARLAGRIDFVLTGLAMGIHLENDAGDLQTLTLLERLDTRIHDGLFRSEGATAGGRFYAEAEVLPGQRWPHYLVVRGEDIHLDKIPGLSSERSTLPSRGTSGRIAGVVNMSLGLTMPSQGMDGPLGQSAGVGEFAISLEDGYFDLEGVSEEPIEGVDGSAAFTLTFEPQLGLISLVEGDFWSGPLHASATGRVEDFPLDTQVVLDWELDEVECQTIVDAIPRALLGPYRGVQLEGTIKPRGWVKLPLYRPLGMRSTFYDYADMCQTVALHAQKEAWPDIEVVARPPTGKHKSVTEIPNGRRADQHDDVYWLNRPFIKRVTEGLTDPETVEVYVGPGTQTYVPLEQLPRYVAGVMYLSEQIDFYIDGPISESLIKKALRLNLDKGRFVYGGSTVTQQLVKNLFLSRDKTFSRKIQEAFISWRIDDVISKDRVLELYLNCIEFAPDVYGIGPAARHYFQKDARNLSVAESIFLAMLKPSPWYGEAVVERGRTPTGKYWVERMDELAGRLVEHGFLTKAEAEAAKPYSLEWDKDGRYIDRDAIHVPLLDW